jgi:hypothetical protein
MSDPINWNQELTDALTWPVTVVKLLLSDKSANNWQNRKALMGYAQIAAGLGTFYYMQGGFHLQGSYIDLLTSYAGAGAAFAAAGYIESQLGSSKSGGSY